MSRGEVAMAGEINIVYPSQYETEVLLKDGSRMRLRPIKMEDIERWLDEQRDSK